MQEPAPAPVCPPAPVLECPPAPVCPPAPPPPAPPPAPPAPVEDKGPKLAELKAHLEEARSGLRREIQRVADAVQRQYKAAVDEEKRRQLRQMARCYLRRLRSRKTARQPRYRFDILSLYLTPTGEAEEVTLFRDAFAIA